MRCDNCRCVVPDNYDYCMYCGHLLPKGSTKTVPIQEYNKNMEYYSGSYRTEEPYYGYERYNSQNSYYDYNNAGRAPDFYNGFGYGHDSYAPYQNNGYRKKRRSSNGYYNSHQRYAVEDNKRLSTNGTEAKSNDTVLWIVALDILFLLVVLMLLLLVKTI